MQVVFVPGKKLDFETKHNCKKDEQDNFITAVEFSTKNPYGIALALIDIKAGVLQVTHNSYVLLKLNTILHIIFQKLDMKSNHRKFCQVDKGGVVLATRNYISLLHPI